MITHDPWLKARRRSVGIVFLLLLSMLVWLSIAAYNKRFTPVTIVTLRTDSVGNEMHPHADVKVRGVVVGEVRHIAAYGGRAELQLAIQPDKVRHLPANVSAQMLPTTLFGQRFVALILPARPVSQRLSNGSVIGQDRSQNAIELQRVLDSLQELLTAVQPQKLSATLTAIAQALDGRGAELGQTLVRIGAYLKKLNPNLPTLDRDIIELARVAQDDADAAPDILRALDDFTVTSKTIVDQRNNLDTLYAALGGSAQDLDAFLRANKGNIIRLSADSRPTLRLLGRYAPEFPCTLAMVTDVIPAVDKALGKGTDEPGLHVDVTVEPSRGKYLPGRDTPRYTATGGPHCYSVPFRGAASARAPAIAGVPASDADLGPANSPQETELVNELLAAQSGRTPEELPDWSSVLVGPLYRGTKVRLK
jgi:phospholipid/cholesterol/gamma-HCH transport system substrate-binding protein